MRQWCTGEEGEGTLGRDKKPESRASLLAQSVKSLPAVQETQLQYLGWEDLLEKGMATHSSILAWRIPWAEEPSRPQSMGSQRVRHDRVTNVRPRTHTRIFITGTVLNKPGWLITLPPGNPHCTL